MSIKAVKSEPAVAEAGASQSSMGDLRREDVARDPHVRSFRDIFEFKDERLPVQISDALANAEAELGVPISVLLMKTFEQSAQKALWDKFAHELCANDLQDHICVNILAKRKSIHIDKIDSNHKPV